ncbi:hypothetical protein F4680DRAFT_97719 [Xylaria scruposa]|nr:hypothetical protein F4680DRAFT_97719 [Xylaria scruposa]
MMFMSIYYLGILLRFSFSFGTKYQGSGIMLCCYIDCTGDDHPLCTDWRQVYRKVFFKQLFTRCYVDMSLAQSKVVLSLH